MKDSDINETIKEVITLIERKGLSVKQAQKILVGCSDMIMNTKINGTCIANKTSSPYNYDNQVSDLTLINDDIYGGN